MKKVKHNKKNFRYSLGFVIIVFGERSDLVLDMEMTETNLNNLVTKSNKLIEANYKLGVVEQKIILYLASNIQPNDSDFKTYTLPIKEFTNLLGLKGNPKYKELRQITKELMQKVFEIRINKKVIQVSWLSFVAYNETEGTIDLRFDPFLRPYLLQLKKEFTSYKLENVVKLKSSYSIRIYELLKQYEKFHERTFLLKDLRSMLGAEGIYPAYGNFKQRVLVPAQKELNKKTDISFEIEEIKVGRRVRKVCFRITSRKKNTDKPLTYIEENFKDGSKKSDSFSIYAKKLALNMGFQLTDEVLTKWEKYGPNKIITLLEKIQGRHDIDNPIGYITSILKYNVKSTEFEDSTKEQLILEYLIANFRKSKEQLPYWFIQEKAIEEIQQQFHMNFQEAQVQFEKVKLSLCEYLNIGDSRVERLDENIEKKKKELEERLKKYKVDDNIFGA